MHASIAEMVTQQADLGDALPPGFTGVMAALPRVVTPQPFLFVKIANYSVGKVRLGNPHGITSVVLAQPDRAALLGGPRGNRCVGCVV